MQTLKTFGCSFTYSHILRNAKKDPTNTKKVKYLTREGMENKLKLRMKEKKISDCNVLCLKKQFNGNLTGFIMIYK